MKVLGWFRRPQKEPSLLRPPGCPLPELVAFWLEATPSWSWESVPCPGGKPRGLDTTHGWSTGQGHLCPGHTFSLWARQGGLCSYQSRHVSCPRSLFWQNRVKLCLAIHTGASLPCSHGSSCVVWAVHQPSLGGLNEASWACPGLWTQITLGDCWGLLVEDHVSCKTCPKHTPPTDNGLEDRTGS